MGEVFNFIVMLAATFNDQQTETMMKEMGSGLKSLGETVFSLGAVVLTGIAVFLAYKLMTASDDGKRRNAKNQLIYALIGLVMFIIFLVMMPQLIEMIQNAAQRNVITNNKNKNENTGTTEQFILWLLSI